MVIYKELLDCYSRMHFIDDYDCMNLTTVVTITSEILIKRGLIQHNAIQKIDNMWIYPPEYFCPMNYDTGKITITTNTYSIHHYLASWKMKSDVYLSSKLKKHLSSLLTKKIAGYIAKLIVSIRMNGLMKTFKIVKRKIIDNYNNRRIF